MEYRRHQLDNGLEILAECNDRAYTSAFGFFVRTGARDESAEIGGVSHFLEHMVFKGTPKRNAEEVNLKLDEMGSHSNARTSEESTIYHAAVLPEFQTDVVELFSDLMRPSLRSEDFETEKQVILEEIKMYADQPPFGGYEKIMEEFFGSHPLGQSVLGSLESVSGLSSEQMMGYFQDRYCPSNMALAAAGNVDFERLIAEAEEFCGSWKRLSPERLQIRPDYRFGFSTLHQPNSTQQYILQLAPGPASDDELRYATRVMTTIFGDDSGSRLYWEFLDSGLAESAGVGAYEFDDCGAVMSYLCCAPEQAQSNLQRLGEVQQKLIDEGIEEKELELAKRKIASRIVLGSERTENRMFSVGSQWLSRRPFKTVAEIAAEYESVTREQVNEAIRQFPLHQNMTIAVGPLQNLGADE